jgi:hypothetical protein
LKRRKLWEHNFQLFEQNGKKTKSKNFSFSRKKKEEKGEKWKCVGISRGGEKKS